MEPVYKTLTSADWITMILFSSIVFLVISKSLFYQRFMNFIILPFNNKYIFMYNKKDKLLNGFQIFFTFFQLLNSALFVYLAQHILWSPETGDYPFIYPVILGMIIGFIAVKVFLQLSNGFVFNNTRTISELIFKKLSYFNYSALVMFLANVLLTYLFKDSKAVVIAGFLLVILINVMGWFAVLKNHQKFITSHFFYFILYLCALEIAPFVIIANYLKQ